MAKIISIGVLVSLVFFMPACGNKGPTTPDTPVTPTVQSITVTSTNTMCYIGATETFTATANMSNGSTQAITTGTWSTDNLSIATINSSGVATIMGSGTVNVIMTYSGKTGSKSIRGLPNFQGVWPNGTYSIISCTSSGDFLAANFCDSWTGPGWPIELNLVQAEDIVSGTIYLGSLSTSVLGSVGQNGILVLSGQIYSDPFTLDVVTAFESITPGQITGGMVVNFTAAGFSGMAQTTSTITSLIRADTMSMEPRVAGSPVKTPTIQDLVNALRIR